MLHKIPMLRTEHTREDEMLECALRLLRFQYSCIDHVEANLFLSRMEGRANMKGRCRTIKELTTLSQGRNVYCSDICFGVCCLEFFDGSLRIGG
jgi:hypothetical protein